MGICAPDDSGNNIKAKAGDSADCESDPPCDGTSGVPNEQHTECGLYKIYIQNRQTSKLSKKGVSKLFQVTKMLQKFT